MTYLEIQVGNTYEAKSPRRVSCFPQDLVNDRQVLHVGPRGVQYDSPTVGFGRHYPTVPMDRFLKWAGRDVTELMPKNDWRPWQRD